MPGQVALIFTVGGVVWLLLKGKTTSEGFDILEYTNTGGKEQAEGSSLVVNMSARFILFTWLKRALVKNPRFSPSVLLGGYSYDSSSRRNEQKGRESHPDQTNKYKLPIAGQTAAG